MVIIIRRNKPHLNGLASVATAGITLSTVSMGAKSTLLNQFILFGLFPMSSQSPGHNRRSQNKT